MAIPITPQLTMKALLEELPGAQRALFRLYHIGGCASCGFRPEETLAEVCARNDNLDANDVLEKVRTACAEEETLLITPKELANHLNTPSNTPKLIDIRTREEFEAVSLPTAALLNQDVLQTLMSTHPKDHLLVLIDHKGERCLDAAAYFKGHGFSNVKGLRGGIDAWSQEVDPTLPRYTIEEEDPSQPN